MRAAGEGICDCSVGSLSAAERLRYARQIVIPGVGVEGQLALKAARVLIVGLGGLGSPLAYYLAAAGVGSLTLVEDDLLEEHNLQRQILYDQQGLGQTKATLAKARLQELNPYIQVTTVAGRFTAENAATLCSGHHLICACVDNRTTRFQINAACRKLGLPWIDAAVIRDQGTVMTYLPHGGPCYACLHAESESSEVDPATLGVWGAAAGVVGSLQAMEAIKILVGQPEELIVGRMLWCDLRQMQFESVVIAPREDCPCCGLVGDRTAKG